MQFYKYHGAGNDFIVVDNRSQVIPEEKLSLAAQKLCHRNFGVGGDGLVLIENSSTADVKFRIFNPDGSEAEMCGNGIRCFAKHVYDYGIVSSPVIEVETLAGVLKVEVVESGKTSYIKVDMGTPGFEPEKIPTSAESWRDIKVKTPEGYVSVNACNTGVPHAVVFVDSVENTRVEELGRSIRWSEVFPQGTNVNFVEPLGDGKFRIRTYERGVEAETLACGTGITASAVVAYVLGKAGKRQEFIARGGTVYVELETEGDRVKKAYMIGPAELVFRGEIDLNL